MDIRTFFLERHTRVHSLAVNPSGMTHEEDNMLADLSEEEMRHAPNDALNPIAWLLWHMARTEDAAVNTVLRGETTVLDREPWLARLGIEARHIGTGALRREVETISEAVDLEALRAYRAAVGRETQRWVADLDFTTLVTPVTPAAAHRAVVRGEFNAASVWVEQSWANQNRSAASFLSSLAIEHNWLHVGEVWVVRNLLARSGRSLKVF